MKYSFSEKYQKVSHTLKSVINKEVLEEIRQLEDHLQWFFEDVRSLVE